MWPTFHGRMKIKAFISTGGQAGRNQCWYDHVCQYWNKLHFLYVVSPLVDRKVETSVDVKIIYVSTGTGFQFLYVVSTPTPIYILQVYISEVKSAAFTSLQQ